MDAATRSSHSNRRMKLAVIVEVNLASELLVQLDAVLRPGERLTEFVEGAVRNAVEYRRVQTRFHVRGQAAWPHYQRTKLSVPSREVLAKLQVKLDFKRTQPIG